MKKVTFILFLMGMILMSCTQNEMARNYGGTEHIELPPNHVLVTMTWKETDLWLLTVDTTTGVHYFREKSTWGVWEGQIIVKQPKPTVSNTPTNSEHRTFIIEE